MSYTVTLVKGETTVTLPGPIGGSAVNHVKHQGIGLTAGGTRYAYDKGVDRYEVELSWEMLSDTEKTAILDFFHDDVDGVAETWTYTDVDGNTYTARFLDPTMALTKTAGNVWNVTARIELDAILE